MKRCISLLLTLSLILFAFPAAAETLRLPRGTVVVEEDAFTGIPAFTAVVIPASATEIDRNAFSPQITTVYGVTGSAAHQFAADTKRTFVPIDIEIGDLTAARWISPGEEASFSTFATSPIWPLSYCYQLEKDGKTILSTGWQSSYRGALTPTEIGVYDVRVSVRSEWADNERLFPSALVVCGSTDAIRISPVQPDAVLYTSGTLALRAEVSPATANPEAVSWQSADTRIAVVAADGTVAGVTPGKTVITCLATDGSGTRAEYPVTVVQGVDQLELTAPAAYLLPGERMTISAKISPANAQGAALTWISSDESIATVSPSGLVTPVSAGVVTISATAENGMRAAVTLRVYDMRVPTSMSLGKDVVYLNVDENYSLTLAFEPADAVGEAIWSSSNPSVVSVDETGRLTAHASGTATITAVSILDAGVSASRSVTVLNPSRTLIMPARQTKTGGITANLNKIAAVKSSAFEELKALYAAKKISASVMSARQDVISNAFSMYSFPWMTPSYQEYWKAANSENGAKDFKPDIVYYGLPYISTGYYYQRLYNATKAVSENRYTKSGSYYLLNQNNLYNGKYCGNDCSSMVAISYFGVSASGIGDWNTHKFTTTNKFTTLSTSAELYPGDIIVRDYRHVVMFLYYANSAHTQIVVIEQGGTEAGINTISTSVYNTSAFFGNSYIPRRYTSWY